jgi:hypothetical protein
VDIFLCLLLSEGKWMYRASYMAKGERGSAPTQWPAFQFRARSYAKPKLCSLVWVFVNEFNSYSTPMYKSECPVLKRGKDTYIM